MEILSIFPDSLLIVSKHEGQNKNLIEKFFDNSSTLEK